MADLRSAWGGGGRITITGAVTAPGGQKLALNGTGDGVLVWYKDHGVQKLMAVALAANRDATTAWQNVRTDIVAMTNYGNDPFSISIGMTDAQLDAVGFNDRFPGKSNTTHMKVTDSPAAAFVRSKKIGGVSIYAWSSTEADADNAWYVGQSGRCSRRGGDGKSDRCGVIPILEFNPTTLRPL